MGSPHAFASSISASRPPVRPAFAAAAAAAAAARRNSPFASDSSDTKDPTISLENAAFVNALALAIKKSLGIGIGVTLSAPDNDGSGTSLRSGLVLRSAGPSSHRRQYLASFLW